MRLLAVLQPRGAAGGCPGWAGHGLLTWTSTLLLWASRLLGWGLLRGWQSKWRFGGRGNGDALSRHVHAAPCFVFEDRNGVTVSTLLRSEPDLEALPAALASTFFVPAFPLLQNPSLSPFTSPT